jgi:hypothetical protein
MTANKTETVDVQERLVDPRKWPKQFAKPCEHPDRARKGHDTGGAMTGPSYYCTLCERRVFLR